jgi:hypothetical protein
MAQKSKLQKEYQVEDDGTTVVPMEILPEVAPTRLKNTVKRERTEAQKANFEKVVKANQERWAKLRADKEAAVAQSKQAIKEENQAKVDAGTHARVVVKEKRFQKPRQTEAPVVTAPVPAQPEKKPKRVVYETDTDTTNTESDTDYEEYKVGKRQIRREVKKNIKAIQQIDSVVQNTIQNPYAALLASRWK